MYDRRRRYEAQVKKRDAIYNTLIYQIILVGMMVGFLYVAAGSDNPMLQEIVTKLREGATISFDLSQLQKGENTFHYDYVATLLEDTLQKQNGQGGKPNPITKLGKNKRIKAPTGSSLSPIILSTPLGAPVAGSLTSLYGYRLHPTTGEDDFHTGLDIAAPSGTAIFAPLHGVVLETGTSGAYGNYIKIKHNNGLVTHYYHCSKIIAKEGTVVRKGDRIAKVGSTGISTGPHLHFELRYQGVSYDPLWLLGE